jgi:hypothetical protein
MLFYAAAKLDQKQVAFCDVKHKTQIIGWMVQNCVATAEIIQQLQVL